ncbi:hypothetical protein CANCADRAFT_108018 [Tortispora caseinolytica NRRL Y-17796]|uniref:Inositol-pentakisphosphate 2-kinase n=1 Tax=Tortispora caseinolytica NRRL Y-17796 TaxID=767744 RepID=A0A1E4TFM2_9ASCO|nr:hypothetical protein CANCADRAFT_108018 [Tortispora caseinolytica NRRL Y-17796]
MLHLLGVGGANVVFTSDDSPDHVLRFRRDKQIPSSQDVYAFMTAAVYPRLRAAGIDPRSLVDPQIRLISRELLDEAQKLSPVPLMDTKEALLLENCQYYGVSCRIKTLGSSSVGYTDSGIVFISFKPKWLAHSPNAPLEAVHCRTCALNRMRGRPILYCPLRLLSHPREELERFLAHYDLPEKWVQKAAQRFSAAMQSAHVLDALVQVQTDCDPFGILDQKTEMNEKFQVAMATRDCTLYGLIKGDNCVIKLADFDPKDPREKAKFWKNTENNLITGNWYS